MEFQPDFIFHLAAQSLVRTSYESPSETFEINVLGTSYLLASLRKLNKKCVTIIITTDKVYENNETGIAYKENDRLGGFDPYSSSKACAELVTASYKTSFLVQQPLHHIKRKLQRCAQEMLLVVAIFKEPYYSRPH